MRIMENKSKLKNEDWRVFIDNDLTYQERNVRRISVAKAKEMSEKGKRVKIGYFWIENDGNRYIYIRSFQKLFI